MQSNGNESENRFELENYVFELVEGDISVQNVDAIVNAANTSLILGAGVAGAIRRRGGPSIQKECNELAPIRTGDSVLTNGGKLNAKFVIHTAGPIYNQYSPEKAQKLLKNSVINSLKFLKRSDINSITFPAISAGIYGFPNRSCAEIMISTILNYIRENKSDVSIIIRICLYGSSMFNLFLDVFKEIRNRNKE